jgi:probable F420-dependent oxidoreductase
VRFCVTIPGLTLFQGHGGQPQWATDITSAQIAQIAGRADKLGFDYLSVSWHVAMQAGEPAENFGRRWPHSFATAGFLLGATERIRLLTLTVVPCEPPLQMAKAFATLDWISGGRTVPVLLAGYLDWEFRLLGVSLEDRGPMMDEYVAAMSELWTADTAAFDGRFVQFADVVFEPKPRQEPFPLWFGGRTKAALRRIARSGSGWQSYATPFSEMRSHIEYIRSQPEFVAAPRPLDVLAYFVESTHDAVSHAQVRTRQEVVGNDSIIEQLHYLGSIGVDVTIAPLDSMAGLGGMKQPIASVADYIERLEWFAEEIMPAARDIASVFAADAIT